MFMRQFLCGETVIMSMTLRLKMLITTIFRFARELNKIERMTLQVVNDEEQQVEPPDV